MMNFKNKYLFNKYALIIRQNRLVLFCEESSINLSYLKTIKKELKKQNFSLMTIKNNVFNKQFKNYNLKKLHISTFREVAIFEVDLFLSETV